MLYEVITDSRSLHFLVVFDHLAAPLDLAGYALFLVDEEHDDRNNFV